LTDVATLWAAFGSREFWQIVSLSLTVSLSASIAATVIGLPTGVALAIWRFPGRGVLIGSANPLLGLPPVVVGLALYLLLSYSGPLGFLELLFTPAAMVIVAHARAGIAVQIGGLRHPHAFALAQRSDCLIRQRLDRARLLPGIGHVNREHRSREQTGGTSEEQCSRLHDYGLSEIKRQLSRRAMYKIKPSAKFSEHVLYV
jgi:hypothetical protein